MDNFKSFDKQTIRRQQRRPNRGFVSAFHNFNPFTKIRDPSTVRHSGRRQRCAGSFWNLQNPLEDWKSVISPAMLQMLERIHWNPLFSAFGGCQCLVWEHPVMFYFDSWTRSIAQIPQPRPTLSVSLLGSFGVPWGTNVTSYLNPTPWHSWPEESWILDWGPFSNRNFLKWGVPPYHQF